MATKAIDIDLDVYERLLLLSVQARESFSDILRRELPNPSGWTGRDILDAIEVGSFPPVQLSESDEAAYESVRARFLPEADPLDALADTTVLIDLYRGKSPILDLIRQRPDIAFVISPIVVAELIAGPRSRSSVEAMIAPFKRVGFPEDAPLHFGLSAKHLRETGQMIGANDLWLASIALSLGLPVVTRNIAHFERSKTWTSSATDPRRRASVNAPLRLEAMPEVEANVLASPSSVTPST